MKETEFVAKCFPRHCTQHIGADATRARIRADLTTHAYAHFACHGTIAPDLPTKSGLCLADGWLTIDDLSRHDLPPDTAQFAFLSACHSGSASPILLDEAITMAAALQLVGFRHVIATLWAIADPSAPKFARDVYGALIADPKTKVLHLDPDAGPGDEGLPAAYAVHAAVNRLRNAGPHRRPPSWWACYLHSGP